MQNTISVGSFIKFGWETFKKRPWFLVGTTLLWIVLGWGIGFVSGLVGGVVAAGFGSTFGSLASSVLSFGLNSLLAMGWIAFFIKAHDDVSSVTLSSLWHPQKFWSYIGTNILLGIIVIIGFVLLIIPGFIAITMFNFAPYFVVDKGLGPVEALKASARITKGNRLRILAFFAAIALLSLLGFIALIVGILAALPVIVLSYVHAYRSLSTAADAQGVRQPLSGGEITLVILGTLLPLIAVVGILAAVVLASLGSAREKGQEARSGANLKILQLDLELYAVDHNNSYPAELSDMSTDPQVSSSMTNLSLADFSYSQLQNGKSYRLCSNKPVLVGDTCVTPDPGSTTTP